MSASHSSAGRFALSRTRRRWWIGLQAGAVGVVLFQILCDLMFALVSTDLMRLPPCTRRRPMVFALLSVLSSLGATLVAVAMIVIALILAWRSPKAWLIAALIALVALAPLPANIAIFRGIVAYRHLVLSD